VLDMKIQRCERCVFWENPGRGRVAGRCINKRLKTIDRPEKDELAFITEADPGVVEIITGPEFGCVHWDGWSREGRVTILEKVGARE